MFQTINAILGHATSAAPLGESGTFWLPERASTVAGGIDGVFDFILWVCVFFFALILLMLVVFVLKYRHREGRQHEPAAGHSLTLELAWTIIPTILVFYIFFIAFKQFLHVTVEPPDCYEIVATGRMWSWTFTYPDGTQDQELHVPADRPVRVVLRSEDVIHGLYIPSFRVKKDVVPGRFNRLWFQAVKGPGASPDEHDIYCTQYCGMGHSAMLSRAYVHTPADFDAWLVKKAKEIELLPPPQFGERLYKTLGCAGCHSVDGSKVIGPTWKDMFGSQVPLQDGRTVLADDAYVRESILQPQAKIHAGYPPVMPPFTLNEKQIHGLIAYMRTISVNASHVPEQAAPGGTPTTTPTTNPATPVTVPTAGADTHK